MSWLQKNTKMPKKTLTELLNDKLVIMVFGDAKKVVEDMVKAVD